MLMMMTAAALTAAQPTPAAPAKPMPTGTMSGMDMSQMDHSKMDHSAMAKDADGCCKKGADGKMECCESGKKAPASGQQNHQH